MADPQSQSNTPGAKPDAPKIIVDSDWKAQAQKERQAKEAAEKARQASPIPGAAAGMAGAPGAAPGEGAPVGG